MKKNPSTPLFHQALQELMKHFEPRKAQVVISEKTDPETSPLKWSQVSNDELLKLFVSSQHPQTQNPTLFQEVVFEIKRRSPPCENQ